MILPVSKGCHWLRTKYLNSLCMLWTCVSLKSKLRAIALHEGGRRKQWLPRREENNKLGLVRERRENARRQSMNITEGKQGTTLPPSSITSKHDTLLEQRPFQTSEVIHRPRRKGLFLEVKVSHLVTNLGSVDLHSWSSWADGPLL